MSESNVPADVDACPNCEATVRADIPLDESFQEGDGAVRSCPECGAALRRRRLGGWILVERGTP